MYCHFGRSHFVVSSLLPMKCAFRMTPRTSKLSIKYIPPVSRHLQNDQHLSTSSYYIGESLKNEFVSLKSSRTLRLTVEYQCRLLLWSRRIRALFIGAPASHERGSGLTKAVRLIVADYNAVLSANSAQMAVRTFCRTRLWNDQASVMGVGNRRGIRQRANLSKRWVSKFKGTDSWLAVWSYIYSRRFALLPCYEASFRYASLLFNDTQCSLELNRVIFLFPDFSNILSLLFSPCPLTTSIHIIVLWTKGT